MNKVHVYSDINSLFKIDDDGNVDVVRDMACIRQSLISIFSTVQYERVRNPIGSDVVSLLFQPLNDRTARRIRTNMTKAIEQWEPRVTIKTFNIVPDLKTKTYDVDLIVTVNAIGKDTAIRTRMRSFA